MKEILKQLIRKDLKIRYARPTLGFFWAFLSPFLTSLVFYVVFGRILGIQIGPWPFFLYITTALFPWRFLQDSLMQATTSLLDNKNILKESPMPQALIPLSVVLTQGIVFLPSLMILALISWWTTQKITPWIMLLPAVVILHAAIIAGLAISCAVLYVFWRDLKYLLEICLLVLFYSSPAFYALSAAKAALPPALYRLFCLNPFTMILNLYRICLIPGFADSTEGLAIPKLFLGSALIAIVLLAIALGIHRHFKTKINDHLAY
ncbi:MAG: hypothetical protein V1863_00235 [Candidatus Omnitrophota bacterium]